MIKRRSIPWLAGSLCLLAAGGLIYWTATRVFSKKRGENAQPASVQGSVTLSAEAVNGLRVSEEVSRKRPYAVVVENHPDSRPQAGLASADIVYEMLAEGGITRFLAIYQTTEASKIGPVRSARDYSAALADEWGAMFAHVGGSNEVIAELAGGSYKRLSDLNEYYNWPFFERVKNRQAPHNAYTSSELLNKALDFHKFSAAAAYSPWLFKDAASPATTTASEISLNFSKPGYEVKYVYDAGKNAYSRILAGRAHLEEVGKTQIAPATIIVQSVEVEPVPNDPLLHVDIDLKSGGAAYVFLDGKLIPGTWRRAEGRTRYYDSIGQEMEFNRGQIWVELVPKDQPNNVVWK